MRRIKMLGFAGMMIAAVMAVIGMGTASAAGGVLCSTATTPCGSKWPTGTTVDMSLQNGTASRVTDTSGNTIESCSTSTIKGSLAANPDASGTATVTITELTWGAGGSCTVTKDTIVLGALKFESESSGNGIIYADAKTEWTINVFSSCGYGVEAGTKLGTLKEGTGTSAVFTVNAVIKKLNGGFLCPETEKWVAEYVLTSPPATTLYVSAS